MYGACNDQESAKGLSRGVVRTESSEINGSRPVSPDASGAGELSLIRTKGVGAQ